ncbi:tetratricopeptide repeat protein [bacterium]|nr:tetratricopeptide repeat protein [bacterium]
MKKTIFIILLISLTGLSCVYYNTFFLAKKYYGLAEDIRKDAESDVIPPDAENLYTKAIEKGSKVLVLYPESKYVDDALFLIGMCYYWTGNYLRGIRKFDELSLSFPESEHLGDARYYRALCELELGRYVSAYETLLELQKEDRYKERAAFMLAELQYQQKDYCKAVAAYKLFLQDYPESDRVSFVYYRLGTIYYLEGQYQEAIVAFQKIEKSKVNFNDYFNAQLLIGECLYNVGKVDEALAHYQSMVADEKYRETWGDVLLQMGDVYYLENDTAKAREIWEDIIDDYPRTEVAAWAYYKMGMMYQNKYGDFDKAKEMFDLAVSEAPRNSSIKELALSKSESLQKLAEYKSELVDTSVSRLVTQFKVAEMYLMELEHVDSAISTFQYIIENHSSDSLAPKAIYSVGWIYENMKKDSKTADSVYSLLLSNYPETDYAFGAVDYFKSRGTALDSLGVQTVAYYFVKAEEFLFTYEWEDSALKYYDLVIDSFPGSQFVPKAITAKAYIYENCLRDATQATACYQQLVEQCPNTEYEDLALVKLGDKAPDILRDRDKLPIQQETREEYADADTETVADEDTLGDKLPKAPNPKKRGRLIYPEFKKSRELTGRRVQLKIFINYFGEVEDVVLLTPTGDQVIDEALVRAAENTIFDWTEDGFEGDQWYRYEMRITEPQTEEETEEDNIFEDIRGFQ